MFDFRCGRMRKKARCFRSRAIRGAGIGSINVFRSGFRLIRTLGPLIAVAVAGSSLSAETAPTAHSNRAAPISAELASPRRAVHWRSGIPHATSGWQDCLWTGATGLFPRVRSQTRQHVKRDPRQGGDVDPERAKAQLLKVEAASSLCDEPQSARSSYIRCA